MPIISWTTLDLIVLAGTLLVLRTIHERRRRRGLSYPPGPPQLPFVGNLTTVSSKAKEGIWMTYHRLGKPYGDLYSLCILGQRIIILQTRKAVTDLMERRAAIYSHRIYPTIMDMAKFDWALSAIQPDEHWRIGRRSLDRSLRPSAIVQHQPMQVAKTCEFLSLLRDEPHRFRNHIQHLTGAMTMSLAYGYEVRRYDDAHLKNARSALDIATKAALPGALLVNDFPFLRRIPAWVPWLSYQPFARVAYEIGQASIREPWKYVKQELEKGTARPSLALDELLEHHPFKSEEEEYVIMGALGTVFAGTNHDTTTSILESFFLMLALYPDIQARAQAEIDSVTAGERLPTFADRPALHYINAMVKELVRWRPVTPIGAPHALCEDDVYQGYFIPKGTMVIANAWSILHDPEVYPDPDMFITERFLTDNGRFKDDPWLSVAFGAGKRTCPGRFFVDSTVFIVIATVLSTFSVRRSGDVPLELNVNKGKGIVTLRSRLLIYFRRAN
ncbi:cytochrome P450 [Auriscalpium vulgare]|uniref:Cytochrome P450 n=1 Tax=Auriscalpium vulgare TaxID=40419 RepID=A0ACB8RVZ4_9AGAM|nr:cytochrome P450 [Auriscalpium vulgare]